MMSILRVIRYQNLLIVIGTLYLMRYCIIQPLLQQKGLDLQLDNFIFFLLTLATALVTAAGYVINDYFDTKTDLVNHPNAVIVGRSLSRRTAILLHIGLNLMAIAMGFIVSFSAGRPPLGFLFVLVAGILWFYSTTYKRQFLVGNIIVAVLTGIVPLITLLFELPIVYRIYWQMLSHLTINVSMLMYWVGGYALFAFLLTLVREIIKDIEDFEGDITYGRNTLPVVLGMSTAKRVAGFLLFVTLLSLLFLFSRYLNFLPSGEFDYFTFFYLVIFLIFPMLILLIKLFIAQTKKQFHTVSSLSKLIMLFGLLYAVFFRLLIV